MTIWGKDVPVNVFRIVFYTFCNMGPSTVMLKNDFIVSLGVFWSFFLQFSLQFYQLLSVSIASDQI